MTTGRRPRVAVLINLVAPYRAALFDRLAETWDLHVIWTGWEANREGWPREYPDASWSMTRAWGWVIPRSRSIGAGRSREVFHQGYVHLTPGVGRELRAVRPDGIVSWEMGARTVAALRYGRAHDVPVWVCWESEDDATRTSRVRRPVRRWIRQRATGWIAFSRGAATSLVDSGVGADSIVRVQNTVPGVRPEGSSPRSDPSPDAPIVLFLGQLVARKGLTPLMESSARVRRAGHAHSLWIGGDGPLRASLEERADRDGVRFLGRVPHEDVPDLLARCAALVVPSLQEVWGLVVNEACFAATPVAVSRFAGAREVAAPEAVFDPTDPDDFDRVITAAVTGTLPRVDPARVMTLDEVARRIVEGVDLP